MSAVQIIGGGLSGASTMVAVVTSFFFIVGRNCGVKSVGGLVSTALAISLPWNWLRLAMKGTPYISKILEASPTKVIGITIRESFGLGGDGFGVFWPIVFGLLCGMAFSVFWEKVRK